MNPMCLEVSIRSSYGSSVKLAQRKFCCIKAV
jgi:hypothetical protein